MPVPYLSNFSWSKDRIMEQALSSIFYPELRLINKMKMQKLQNFVGEVH